jgi:hypothetical protein
MLMAYGRRRVVLVLTVTCLAGLMATGGVSLSPSAASNYYSMALAHSGLLMADSLDVGRSVGWNFTGDAPHEHAVWAFAENSTGLHISIRAVNSSQWAGFFAKTNNTYAHVFHAVISLPYTTIPSNSFNTGLYVQTSTPIVNYVACIASVSPAGYYWAVLYTQGARTRAVAFHKLFEQAGGPLTRDCTIVTNGQNTLEVYLDGQRVYSNDTMNLQMPAPFNAYLEVESICTKAVLVGTYRNFFEATSQVVHVNGVPRGGSAEIVNPKTGRPLVDAVAGSNGSVDLNVMALQMPINGSLRVLGPRGNVLAESGEQQIWPGDSYQVGKMQQLPYLVASKVAG